jgi:hypothetical protein
MAHSNTWNVAFEAAPSSTTDDVGDGAANIRQFKESIRERFATDHYMNVSGTDADHGQHLKCTFRAQGSDPSNVASAGICFTKDVSSLVELHFKDDANTVVQLTSNGKVGASTVNSVFNVSTITTAVITTGNFTDVNISDDLEVTDDSNIGGDLAVTGTVTYGTLNDGSDDLSASHAEINSGCDGMGVTIPRIKILELPTWNMDANANAVKAHGLTAAKIVGAIARVVDDTGSAFYDLSGDGYGSLYWNSTNIVCIRTLGGQFDNASFDATASSRGYIVVFYID